MPYTVNVGRRVRKAMTRFPRHDQLRIRDRLRELAQNPRPPGCIAMRTEEGGWYRVRVGDYRIVYTVHDDEEAVAVMLVGRRNETIYKQL